jgi:hypothetical protein
MQATPYHPVMVYNSPTSFPLPSDGRARGCPKCCKNQQRLPAWAFGLVVYVYSRDIRQAYYNAPSIACSLILAMLPEPVSS